MKTRKSTLLLATAALCTWPLAAAAQEEDSDVITSGEIEAGIGRVSDDSFYFNEYTGITDTDPYFFGNFLYQQRSAYDSDSTNYIELQAYDLGLPAQSAYIEAGRQGVFSVFGEYDAIPHLRFDDGQTPYSGAGTGVLTLPAGWVPAPDANLLPFAGNLKDLEVKTERARIGAGFSVNLNRNWTFSTAFRNEEKDGIETIAGIFGTNGGSFASAILPRPVDFTTQEAEAAFTYGTERLQANIRYNLSLFDNNQNSLRWENAYTAPGGTEGQLALEPNNSAHHLSASLGYLLSERTRLTGSLSLGRMVQDDDFLPYTINPNLIGNSCGTPPCPLEPLPRDNLDGEVNTIHATLGTTTRPTQNTDLKAQYTFDDRDNQTPVDTYLTVPNDTADQGTTADARARRNRPYSTTKHKVELEGGYRITSDTRLSLGYDFEAINRDLQEVEDTREHTVGAKVRSTLSESTSGYLSYDYSTRSGSAYVSNVPFLVSHDEDFLDPLPPASTYEQNPYMRKFYMADRERHLAKGGLNWFPNDALVLGLNGSYSLSDYDALIGLTGSSYLSGTFDANYTTVGNLSITGYFIYEQIKYQQTGYERGTEIILPGNPLADLTLLWDEDSTENTYTLGVEVAVPAIPDTLDLVFDAAYSDSTIGYDITTQLAGVEQLPDLTWRLFSIGVHGDYHATDGIIFRLGYRYQTLDSNDFALAGIDEPISSGVFGLGNGEPEYDAHVVAGSVVVTF